MYARRLRGAIGAYEASVLTPRALERVVRLTRWHAEALGHELEVVDQRLHAGGEFMSRWQRDLPVGGDVRALGQPVQRLLDDLDRLVELGVADPEAGVVVAGPAD